MERITVTQEGFYGIFHPAIQPKDSQKAVIVIGGSEGNENIPMNVGAMFAERGITALGICYWNVDGLPKEFIRVPIDPFEKAIQWLKSKGYEKIFIYGISEGGKLALLRVLPPLPAGVYSGYPAGSLCGIKIPVIILMVVDLPAPLLPIYPTISPFPIVKEISSTAVFTTFSLENKPLMAPLSPGYFLGDTKSLEMWFTSIINFSFKNCSSRSGHIYLIGFSVPLNLQISS